MRKTLMLLLAMAVSGCTSTGQLRSQASPCTLPSDAGVASTACVNQYNLDLQPTGQAKAASLNFVEFTEQGHFHDRKQLEAVLQRVKERGDKQDIILFIHGWRHSALAEDENVKEFVNLLRRLSDRNDSRTVTGVYVGWRGAAMNPQTKPLDLVTFWDRKNVSMEVGRGALIELTQRLAVAGNVEGNRMISIGHSFGGSALLSATKNEIYKSVLADLPEQRSIRKESAGGGASALEQLTVLVNPAIEATHFLEVHDVIEEVSRTSGSKGSATDPYAKPVRPRIMVFASEGDGAVKTTFPLARRLGTLLETHVDLARIDHGLQPVTYSERDMDIRAIGQFEPFQTHRLEAAEGWTAEKDGDIKSRSWSRDLGLSSAKEGWVADFKQSKTRLKHLGRSPAFSPAWLVTVDEKLIPDHGGIWSDGFNWFLEELVLLTP